jgi:hypothetical protein
MGNAREGNMSWKWIVISGSLIDTMDSGGFEFIGPFLNEEDAIKYRNKISTPDDASTGRIVLVVELLSPGDWEGK